MKKKFLQDEFFKHTLRKSKNYVAEERPLAEGSDCQSRRDRIARGAFLPAAGTRFSGDLFSSGPELAPYLGRVGGRLHWTAAVQAKLLERQRADRNRVEA